MPERPEYAAVGVKRLTTRAETGTWTTVEQAGLSQAEAPEGAG